MRNVAMVLVSRNPACTQCSSHLIANLGIFQFKEMDFVSAVRKTYGLGRRPGIILTVQQLPFLDNYLAK